MSRKRSGRPPLLGERDKRHLLRIVARGPYIGLGKLKRRAGLHCSRMTILRFLKEGSRVASAWGVGWAGGLCLSWEIQCCWDGL